jgi:Zn-dependent protease
MTDLLLILFTLALLILIHLMRTLLAVRIPAELRFKPTKLKQPPDIMADLFAQTDQALSDLGFSRGHWATVHTTPPLPGFSASLIRLYRHKRQPIVARVSPPHSILSTDRCQVIFLSMSKGKTFLATANRVPELFPRPPEKLSITLNSRADSITEQFRDHIQEMSRRGLTWLDRSEEKGERAWVFRLANRYEHKSVQWLNATRYIKRLADGSAVPKIGTVLRFIWRFATGREQNPPRERSPIPPSRAAYLYHNWQCSNRLPPPVSTQLGLFIISALAFVLLAGLFWDWTIALMLLGVIGFHEAGHWLTMRMLGYGNLQILMLPLVGGVTLGQEKDYTASQRVLVSLMGPLPGIILGTILLVLFGMEEGRISELGIILLLVNYLNLLPILPLDGGQLLKALIPIERFGLLIALEWLGTAALLLLGWLTGSLFLAAMALLPLFGALTLMKRKQILKALGEVDCGSEQPPHDQIVSVIQAIDETDRRYRPLVKKAQEIAEIITALRLKPAAPAITGLFLATYLATFLLPPVVVYTTSPGIASIATLLFSDIEVMQQEARDQAMTLPIPQLVTELAERHGSLSDPYRPEGESIILRAPATNEAISRTEARLGVPLDTVHRRFLETSNGFINLWSSTNETDYLLFPGEQIERFAQQLPGIVKRLRMQTGKDEPPLVHILQASAPVETEGETLNLNQIAHMLYIGNLNERAYLLLDSAPQPDTPASLLVIYESPLGLEGTRFKSLHHYLANKLAETQILQRYTELSE